MARKFITALAATAALALTASAANATVFAGNWYLDELKTSDPGLVLAASVTSGAFFADLGPSDGVAANGNEEIGVVPLFSLYTTENSIDGDDIFITGTAKLRFVFDLPNPNSGPTQVTGVTGGLVIPFLFKGGYLDWNPGNLLDTNGKMQLNFGPHNDGLLSIYVNGGVFNGVNKQLPVAATFDWDHAATAAPEPAAWALMIGGFGLAGGALRRRRTASATA
jgi:hypothetical protein